MTEYERGISDAKAAVHALMVKWLDDNRREPEENQLGYPPWHYHRAIEAIGAVAVTGKAQTV